MSTTDEPATHSHRMVTVLLLLPTFLCALVMAAHFLRDSGQRAGMGDRMVAGWDMMMVAFSLVLPWTLLIRRRVVLRMMQLLLCLAAIDLFLTGYDIVQRRIAERDPDVVAPAIIMGAVGGFCLLAAALYQTKRLKTRYAVDT